MLRRGAADKVIAEVLKESGASSVHFARDYAPWSGGLERRVKEACEAAGAACHRYGGFLLHEPESIRNGSGEPYRVYTPFSKACFAAGEPKPLKPVPKFTPWDGRAEERPRWPTGACCPRSPTGRRAWPRTGRRARRAPPHG